MHAFQETISHAPRDIVCVKWHEPANEFRGTSIVVKQLLRDNPSLRENGICIFVPDPLWARGIASALKQHDIRYVFDIENKPVDASKSHDKEVVLAPYVKQGHKAWQARVFICTGLVEGVFAPANFAAASDAAKATLQKALTLACDLCMASTFQYAEKSLAEKIGMAQGRTRQEEGREFIQARPAKALLDARIELPGFQSGEQFIAQTQSSAPWRLDS